MKHFLLCTASLVAGWLEAGELGPPKDISFQAVVDGTTQRYVELLPVPFVAEEPHHLMVALHGHGSDRWQFVRESRGEAKAARDAAAKNRSNRSRRII